MTRTDIAAMQAPPAPAASAPQNMIWIPGGTFRMGSDKHYPEEAPVHRVGVDGFWIERTPVTNREFRRFVNATGYVDPKRTWATVPVRAHSSGSPAFVSGFPLMASPSRWALAWHQIGIEGRENNDSRARSLP